MQPLFENTWVQTDRGVRIFLLTGTKRALVVDTGMTGLDIRALVSPHTDLPPEVLCTHADRDHIAGNSQFPFVYLHPSEAAFYHRSAPGAPIRPVFAGDVIDLGERALEIVHLPGTRPAASRCWTGKTGVSSAATPFRRTGIFLCSASSGI